EDVVGAEMHQGAAQVAADESQIADGPGVDGERGRRFALGLVHEVVGSTVNHNVGPQFGEGGPQHRGLGQVGLDAREGQDVANQTGAEVAAELSGSSEDGVFHSSNSLGAAVKLANHFRPQPAGSCAGSAAGSSRGTASASG